MRYIKANALFLALMSSVIFSGTSAFADDFGVVDLNKIVNNYVKAQEVIADLKVKETELEKFVAEARKDIKVNESSDKKALTDKYNKQLQEKNAAYKQEEAKKLAQIQQNIYGTIKNIADQKKIKAVFKRDSLIYGAQDLTDDVITGLNSKPEK